MLTLALLLAAQAANHSGHAPTTAPTPPAKAEKKVCKKFEDTASRLGSKRVCRTAAEWAAMEARGEREKVDSTRSGRSY